jgi:hypothetical protein
MARRQELATVEERTEQLRQQVEHWRRTRQKRRPMPADLWGAATALAEEIGVYRVARTLSVDYASLQRRVAPAGTVAPDAAELVEFRAVQQPAANAGVGHVIEVSRADGSRLVVRLAPGADFDIGAVVGAFGRLS